MKKIISWGMMLAAAFTLTNCAKEIEDPNQQAEKQGHPFEIVASTVDTKTVNEGMATKWDDNDAINLFHAVAGEQQDYGTNDEFTIADVETGRFTGTLTKALEAGKSYDWYALYPYNSHIATPGEREDGYTYIGHSKGLNQTGYDNMASLKETICPLYGVAKAVPSSDTPSITMNHLTSVVAIKVTNTTEEPLTIEKASLTAEEDIVGSYYIDITQSPVVYKASGEGYVKNTAVVNVSNGTDLAKGESATLYLAIKPFTAETGTSLTLSVNDYAKEPKVLTSDVTFHAGKIKTLNFAYDYVAPKTVTWDLSKNETSEATENKIAWTSDYAEMYCEKEDATTNANNYYGGVNERTSTRFYKNSVLTIAPKAGYKITSVVFTATGDSYAAALSSSTWANASAEVNSTTVTVTPTNGTQPMTATIGGTCGFTSVVVYYTENEGGETPEPEPKTLVSIAVEGAKTEYTVGDSFVEPTVKATYDDASTATVTGATFTGYDMTTAGEQTVTVSYTDGDATATTTYDISVSPAEILVEDGTYVIAVKEDGVYYAASTEANGARRAYVELSGYSSGDYVSHNSKIVWTITNKASGISVSSGDQYWKAVNNGISLVESANASAIKVANSTTDGAYFLSGDCGNDDIRYLAKNGTYGFGFYAESNKDDIYLIPTTFVELPTLNAPVVEAVLNGEETGIDVSWGEVENATSYVVSCTNQTDQIVTSGTQCSFTDLPAGTYTITVTAKAENYNSSISANVDVEVPSRDDTPTLKTFVVKSDDIVNNSKYQAYTGTVDNRSWMITWGGNNKSVGTNSSNRSKCTLSSYSKYAVSPVTTSMTASAFASTTSISNVSKISYAALSGGKNHTSTKIYVLYSADGNTFSQISLTSGEQGTAINATSGGEFEFASCSGYFAVVFVATNASGDWRLDDVNLTFTYSE